MTRLTVILVLRTTSCEAVVREALLELDCEIIIATPPDELDPSGFHAPNAVAIVELGDGQSIARLRHLRGQGLQLRYACLAQNHRAEDVVDAVSAGALDVLSLPLNTQRLRALLDPEPEGVGFEAHLFPLGADLQEVSQDSSQESPLTPIQQVERAAIVRALRESQWNAVRAANALGIGGATVYRKIKRYGIDLKQLRRQNPA